MKSTKTSLKVFGIYMMLIPGIGLMTVPDLMLDFFKLSYGEQLWIPRMIGLLAFIIGVFDFHIAKHELTKLYKITVLLRYFAAFFMIALWLKGEVEVTILLFAGVDAAGAFWTMLTLKKVLPSNSSASDNS
jgi:protein-S-isoprenylcysteine O-methyltransferase Ste14